MTPLAIPFGAAVPGPGTPTARAVPDRTLRFHDVDLGLPAHGSLAALGATPRALVRAALLALARTWDALTRRFLERYLAFVDRAIARAADLVAARLTPFRGLYKAEDYAFSAPVPLPQAHLPLGALRVPVDVLFWPAGPAAALASPSPLTPGRARERHAQLEAAGVPVVTYTTADGDDDALFATLLGDDPVRLLGLDRPPVGPRAPFLRPTSSS